MYEVSFIWVLRRFGCTPTASSGKLLIDLLIIPFKVVSHYQYILLRSILATEHPVTSRHLHPAIFRILYIITLLAIDILHY